MVTKEFHLIGVVLPNDKGIENFGLLIRGDPSSKVEDKATHSID